MVFFVAVFLALAYLVTYFQDKNFMRDLSMLSPNSVGSMMSQEQICINNNITIVPGDKKRKSLILLMQFDNWKIHDDEISDEFMADITIKISEIYYVELYSDQNVGKITYGDEWRYYIIPERVVEKIEVLLADELDLSLYLSN